MAFTASGDIEISAPPATVFAWLTERERLERWVEGNLDMMPADPSELRVGYRGKSTFTSPDGTTHDLAMEVTGLDPPRRFAFRETYPGSTTEVEYRLAESGGGTRLDAATSTEWETSQMDVFKAVEEQIATMPRFAQAIARAQMERAEERLEHSDVNPRVEADMQRQFAESLARLKEAVETGG
jgi:uncharacterized protein YndB with AHSA1/START domain